MKRRLILSFLGIMVFAFAKAQSVNATYLCLSNGDVVLADLGNCTSTIVASHTTAFLDIAQGDTDDTLYAIRGPELFRINVTTGVITSLGNLTAVGTTGSFSINSLVREGPGVLLAVHEAAPGNLFRIDVAAMTATNLGAVNFASAGDLTFFNGNLYLSASNNQLVQVDRVNPSNSVLVGTIPSTAGFGNVFGVVSVITGDPCAIDPTFALVATGGNDTRFVDVTTAQTTFNCSNLVSFDIFGAAEVAADVICSIDLEITDANGLNAVYCQNANTTLNTTVDPLTPIGVYSYEWSIQGQAGVIGTSAVLPININATTTYNCVVTDSGRVAPDNIASSSITVTVLPSPVWNPIANVIAHSTYTLPAITGTNIPTNTAFYDNPAHTGTPWNTGDVLDSTMFTTNPATIYVYGIDVNGCELIEQFDIEFVDVQVTITPGGIQDVCEGDMLTLTATPLPAVAYGIYTYNWSDTQGNTYPNTASITITFSATTTISVTVNDSGVENGTAMGFDMADFNVLPQVNITDLADQNAGVSFTFPPITGTGLTGGAAYYTQPNGLGTVYMPGDIVTASDFTSLPIILYLYDDNGVCNDQESFVLDIGPPAALTLSLSSSGNNFCAGETIILTAIPSPAVAQGIFNYEWREQGTTALIATTASFSVSPQSSTVYECVITDSGLTIDNTATASITITVVTSPVLNPILNQNAMNSFTLPPINGSNLSGNQSFYTQPGGLGNSFMPGDVIQFTDFISYPVTLYVYDINGFGCEDEISFELIITLEPEEPLFIIPDYMTPNNDGFNDFWNIEVNSEDINVRSIYIFDRYGKLLKQLDPNGIGWDATYNGNPMPSSSYWYLIEYEVRGVFQKLNGYFAVKR